MHLRTAVVSILLTLPIAMAQISVSSDDSEGITGSDGVVNSFPTSTLVLEGFRPDGEDYWFVNGAERHAIRLIVDPRGSRFEVPMVSPGLWELQSSKGDSHCRVRVRAFRAFFSRPPDKSAITAGIEVPRGVVLARALSRLIGAATSSVEAAISDFDDPVFVEALVAAKKRGVKVRMVADQRLQHAGEAARARLNDAGIPWHVDPRPPTRKTSVDGMMHHKFVVIDGMFVWTGHAKPELANGESNQCAVGVLSRPLAAAFITEFDELFGDGDLARSRAGADKLKRPPFVHNADGASIEAWFQPNSVRDSKQLFDRIVQAVEEAKSEVVFLVSGFGSAVLSESLRRASERGVAVWGVPGRPDWRESFAIAYDLVGLGDSGKPSCSHLFAPGEWAAPGVEAHVHNRLMIVDRETVLITSAAWNRNTTNDENLLVVRDRVLAAQFLAHAAATIRRAGGRYEPVRLRFPIEGEGEQASISGSDFAAVFGRRSIGAGSDRYLIGGWTSQSIDESLALLDAPKRRPRILDAKEAMRRLRLAELPDLGVAVGLEGDRVIGRTAEGLQFEIQARSDDPLKKQLAPIDEHIPCGFAIGPYVEGVELPSDRSTDADGSVYAVDARGMPLVTDGGLVQIGARRPRKATAFKGASNSIADFGLIDLLAPLEADITRLETETRLRFVVGEISCRNGGFPDYNRDGFIDEFQKHLVGSHVRLSVSKPVDIIEFERIIATFGPDFSPITLSGNLAPQRGELRRWAAVMEGWRVAVDTPARIQVYHGPSRTSIQVVAAGLPSDCILLELRDR